MDFDVAIVGAGMSGMATAARLQARGCSTVVLESHCYPGGCAGFFRRKGFAFDVGATTLVDFEAGGVGGELLRAIGMPSFEADPLPGYRFWLPDRTITLHRDTRDWVKERVAAFGNSARMEAFWALIDRIAAAFWGASRHGIRLPLRTAADLIRAAQALAVRDWPLARFLNWSMGDALRAAGLRDNKPLAGLLAALVEDTVHSTLDEAPLINAALGITIRGAGLTRARGGMYGFWKRFLRRYRELGGTLRLNCPVVRIERWRGGDAGFLVHTATGVLHARQVVSTVPAPLTAELAGDVLGGRLDPYLHRNKDAEGGAVVLFLGIPEEEVEGQGYTHHQILQDYEQPLGNGNNMFLSVSAAGDTESAPAGHRAVMVSTHCGLADWQNLRDSEYLERKMQIANHLLKSARRVYPKLGGNPSVLELATPRTYERFTRRPRGAVGGYRLRHENSNQRAIPHDLGSPGFWMCGDTTWPGLGTVACVLGSRIVSQSVSRTLAVGSILKNPL